MIVILSKLFQKIFPLEAEGIFPDAFREASVTPIPNPDKDVTSHEHRYKNPHHSMTKLKPTMYKN